MLLLRGVAVFSGSKPCCVLEKSEEWEGRQDALRETSLYVYLLQILKNPKVEVRAMRICSNEKNCSFPRLWGIPRLINNLQRLRVVHKRLAMGRRSLGSYVAVRPCQNGSLQMASTHEHGFNKKASSPLLVQFDHTS